MVEGLVFGKFLPFHKGHEAMILFAKQQCNQLTVIICSSDKENISCQQRVKWIEETFQNDRDIKVLGYPYKEDELPNTSVTSEIVSRLWAQAFLKVVPQCDLLVTSEPYGDLVSAYMGIRHVSFDIPRNIVPISASLIRGDLFRYWQYLPDAVRPFYAKKVVLLGTESTGKSTLTSQLAVHYNATEVPEVGRQLIADSSDFTLADLYRVAHAHADRIDAEIRSSKSPLVFIDTDVYITQSYANYVFAEKLQLPATVYATNKAEIYLYLCKDVPHVQDGTRFDEDHRNRLDKSHRETLAAAGIVFLELSGEWDKRFALAIDTIDRWYLEVTGLNI